MKQSDDTIAKIIAVLMLLASIFFTGCATFSTEQIDVSTSYEKGTNKNSG